MPVARNRLFLSGKRTCSQHTLCSSGTSPQVCPRRGWLFSVGASAVSGGRAEPSCSSSSSGSSVRSAREVSWWARTLRSSPSCSSCRRSSSWRSRFSSRSATRRNAVPDLRPTSRRASSGSHRSARLRASSRAKNRPKSRLRHLRHLRRAAHGEGGISASIEAASVHLGAFVARRQQARRRSLLRRFRRLLFRLLLRLLFRLLLW